MLDIVTQSEEQRVKAIKAHVAKGDQAKDKSDQHYISAGQHLESLKSDGVHKTRGMTWEVYCKEICGLSRSRADQLIMIADGRTSVEKERAANAERMRQSRQEPPTRVGGKPVLRNTDSKTVDDLVALIKVELSAADECEVEADTARLELGRALQEIRKLSPNHAAFLETARTELDLDAGRAEELIANIDQSPWAAHGKPAPDDEAPDLEDANKLNRELLEFVVDYCPRTLAWHKAHPNLLKTDRDALVANIYQCAEEVMRLAQAIDGR